MGLVPKTETEIMFAQSAEERLVRIRELEQQLAVWKSGATIAAVRHENKRLLDALQNIANGNTPWLDTNDPATSTGQIYERYAQKVIAEGK